MELSALTKLYIKQLILKTAKIFDFLNKKLKFYQKGLADFIEKQP